MTRKYSSISVETTLASSINTTATTMTVATGTGTALMGGISLGAGNVDIFTVSIDADTINEEIVYVTDVSGDTLTISRGRAGTGTPGVSGIAHSSGASVKHVLTSDDLTAFETAVSPVTNLGFSGSTSGTTTVQATAIAGTTTLTLPAATDTLVGKATIDILTNKTLTAPVISTIANTGTITLPTSTDTLVGRATTDTLTNKNLTSGTNTFPTSLVTETGTQTLTNKTLTSPVLTTPSISNISAKGDILVGTANDTLGILPLGTNDFILTADSNETTGLKWSSSPSPSYSWIDFTPTVTQGASVTFTNNWAKYVDVGPIRFIDVSLSMTSSGTINNDIVVSLPSGTFASTGGIYGTTVAYFSVSGGLYVPGLVEAVSATTVKFQQAHVTAASGQYIGDADNERLLSGSTIVFSLTARK